MQNTCNNNFSASPGPVSECTFSEIDHRHTSQIQNLIAPLGDSSVQEGVGNPFNRISGKSPSLVNRRT